MPAGISNASNANPTVTVINSPAEGKTIILRSGNRNSTGATDLYTVPAGKTFFVCSMTLSLSATAAGCWTQFIAGPILGTNKGILRIDGAITPTYHTQFSDQHAWTPTVPIPLTAGEVCRLDATITTGTAYASVMGWVV